MSDTFVRSFYLVRKIKLIVKFAFSRKDEKITKNIVCFVDMS